MSSVDIEKIKAMAAQGYTQSKAAKELGCDRSTVIRASKKEGIEWNGKQGRKRKLSTEQLRAEVAKAAELKESQSETATRLGYGQTGFSRALKNQGVEWWR